MRRLRKKMNDMQTTVDTEVCCGISNTQRFIGAVVGVLALTILAVSTAVHGRDFFCAGADIECLFDSITEAKFNGEPNTIFLDNGIYSGLQLPSIAGPFPLSIIGQEPAVTIIESGELLSTIFFIAPEANLTLDALTLTGYRITLSALASTFGGIVRPICLAVLRLITSSNFVGCSTGRSAGLAPLRILST